MLYPKGEMHYGFVMLHPSGSIYAVRYNALNGIEYAYGPVHHREVRTKYLPNFDHDRQTGDWLFSLGSEVRELNEEQMRAIEEQNT
jgi:hypothetical protein